MSKLTEYGDLLFVEVPKDVKDIVNYEVDNIPKMAYSTIAQDPFDCGGDLIHLPPGSWELIGLTNSMGESECMMATPPIYPVVSPRELKNIIEITEETFVDYEWLEGDKERPSYFETAKESFQSLLTHLGITDNRAVLKKVNK